jgi:ferredoxin, 2Fe-2S
MDTGPVASVRVEPSETVIEVQKGEPLMRAAERLGYHWPTLCHGQAECTACWIEVDDPDAFEKPSSIELDGLRLFEGRSFYAGKKVRLACQAHPVRDTVVTKRGVRPSSRGVRPSS